MSPIERQDPFSCYGQNGYGVGNFVIGNFLRGQEGKGAHAFEISRGKKVVWKFADHEMVRSATMVRVLDEE